MRTLFTPNHPEYADRNHTVRMNGGVVIKYNANQRYTTDAVSEAIFKSFCDKAGVKTQFYANRADMAGGGTLGNIANTQVSLNTVDIGLAQLVGYALRIRDGGRGRHAGDDFGSHRIFRKRHRDESGRRIYLTLTENSKLCLRQKCRRRFVVFREKFLLEFGKTY